MVLLPESFSVLSCVGIAYSWGIIFVGSLLSFQIVAVLYLSLPELVISLCVIAEHYNLEQVSQAGSREIPETMSSLWPA